MLKEDEDFVAFLADVSAALFGLLVRFTKDNPLSDFRGFPVLVAGGPVRAAMSGFNPDSRPFICSA